MCNNFIKAPCLFRTEPDIPRRFVSFDDTELVRKELQDFIGPGRQTVVEGDCGNSKWSLIEVDTPDIAAGGGQCRPMGRFHCLGDFIMGSATCEPPNPRPASSDLGVPFDPIDEVLASIHGSAADGPKVQKISRICGPTMMQVPIAPPFRANYPPTATGDSPVEEDQPTSNSHVGAFVSLGSIERLVRSDVDKAIEPVESPCCTKVQQVEKGSDSETDTPQIEWGELRHISCFLEEASTEDEESDDTRKVHCKADAIVRICSGKSPSADSSRGNKFMNQFIMQTSLAGSSLKEITKDVQKTYFKESKPTRAA